jgi:hypothetical protein
MAIILVGSTTTLAAGDHVQMHNTYAIDRNVPTGPVFYVAGTTGWVGINTVTAGTNPSGILDVVAGTTGITPSAFIPPRMSTANKNAIANPVVGMIIYDNNLGTISVYTGGTSPTWKSVFAF